jgi:hypothetical protein
MRAYYWKVFRHLLSTTVLMGFLGAHSALRCCCTAHGATLSSITP